LVVGLIILFLILVGIPVNLPSLAVLSFLLVALIFGVRLARRLQGRGFARIMSNALAAGAAAAVLVYLFMALINSWQAKGIDVKQYFDAVNANTVSLLSGVPVGELHANPPRDVLTGAYPEGAALRTDPMRLTFDPVTALRLQLGLAGKPVADVSLGIGGFYGFMLLLVISSLLGALLTWGAFEADFGRYRAQAASAARRSPLTHWLLILSPALVFVLLRLTEPQGGRKAILSGGSGAEIQLLLAFALVLFALVANRAADRIDHGFSYSARVALVATVAGALILLGLWRILDNHTYFIPIAGSPRGSPALSVGVALAVSALVLAQNVRALRDPTRFEPQLAGTQAILGLLFLPLFLDQYQNDVMTLVGINILLGIGLNIVVGYAGLLDLGYVAFFALGAYTYAFLSSNQEEFVATGQATGQSTGLKFAGNDQMVINFAGGITITVVVTALIAVVGMRWWQRRERARRVAAPARTLLDLPPRPGLGVTTGLVVLAVAVSLIVTGIIKQVGAFDSLFGGASPFLIGLAAALIVSGLAGILLGIPVLRLRGDYLAIVTLGFGEIIRLLFNNLRDFTGGPQGVLQIPRPLPAGAQPPVTYLWLVYLVMIGAALVAFFSMRLKQSRTGRAWSAMRSDEDIAQSMGVNLVQSKLTAFAIGAAFAGVGGVLFAARQQNIFPGDFQLAVSIEVLSLVIIGGMGSIPGVIMGAVVLIGVPEVLRALATYRIMVFGALLVAMVILRPEGLLPAPPAQLSARARALIHGARPAEVEEAGK